MKTIKLMATALVLVAANVAVYGGDPNDKICDKNYRSGDKPWSGAENFVCKKAGDSAPRMRDCLISEREKTGGASKDTFRNFTERHVKCGIDTLKNGRR